MSLYRDKQIKREKDSGRILVVPNVAVDRNRNLPEESLGVIFGRPPMFSS